MSRRHKSNYGVTRKSLNDYDNPHSLFNKFRNKRFQIFNTRVEQLHQQKAIVSIIDVGGTESFWKQRGYDKKTNVQITLVNLFATETRSANIKSIKGDATALDLPSKSFDIAFSNSVIEHLYTWDNQQKMAQEVQRIADYYFLQTPNKYFIMEPHAGFPLFQFLPRSIQFYLLTKTRLCGYGEQFDENFANTMLDELRLLSKQELSYLFPNGELIKEKFFLLTKSLMVTNLKR